MERGRVGEREGGRCCEWGEEMQRGIEGEEESGYIQDIQYRYTHTSQISNHTCINDALCNDSSKLREAVLEFIGRNFGIVLPKGCHPPIHGLSLLNQHHGRGYLGRLNGGEILSCVKLQRNH